MTNPTFETLEIGADADATIKLSREHGCGSNHTEMTVITYTDEGEEGAKESAQVTVSGNWETDFAPLFMRALKMWGVPDELPDGKRHTGGLSALGDAADALGIETA